MSKEQRGFIVYGDIQDVLTELDDQQAAQLFRGMVDYFVSGKDPKFTGVLKFVFIPIKQQMDRDKEKYDAKCEKNRAKIQKYWDSVKSNTNENNSIQTYSNATNTKTNTNTDTKTNTNTDTKTNTDTDTDTTTNTDTKARSGGASGGDEFDIWKRLDADGIDAIYAEYPESGGLLIEEVATDVRTKRKKVRNAVSYILGYAKKVGWDDKAEHFDGGGMA